MFAEAHTTAEVVDLTPVSWEQPAVKKALHCWLPVTVVWYRNCGERMPRSTSWYLPHDCFG